MADELSINLKTTLSHSGLVETFNTIGTEKFTQAVIGSHAPTVIVGTGEEDYGTGDISTLGYLFMRNLEPTGTGGNYVTYGPKNGGNMIAFGRIEGGESAMMRLEPGITMRWQANTASVKIKTLLLED